MYMIEHKNMAYFYHSEELMIDAILGSDLKKMGNACYAVELQKDKNWCRVIKDRSDMFLAHTIPFKKFVKIVKILMED